MLQIACRLIVRKPLEPATKSKISMFCHVASEQVIGVHDVSSVYHVPLLLQSQGIVQFLQKRLNLGSLKLTQPSIDRGLDLERRWRELTSRSVLSRTKILSTHSSTGRSVSLTK